jgi:acetyl-CoA C-acetyltransferase
MGLTSDVPGVNPSAKNSSRVTVADIKLSAHDSLARPEVKQYIQDVYVIETVRVPFGDQSKPSGKLAASIYLRENLALLFNKKTRQAVLEKCKKIKNGDVPKGALEKMLPTNLGKHTLDGLKQRLPREVWNAVQDVIGGTVTSGKNGQGLNISRMEVLASDLPLTTGGLTINRMCGSALEAMNQAFFRIASRQADVIIAGGTEHMNAAPIGSDYDKSKISASTRMRPNHHQIIAADLIARKYGFNKNAQDAFAMESQQKYERALSLGKYRKLIHEISEGDILLNQDEHPRKGCTFESVAKVKAVPASHFVPEKYDYRLNESISAANASGIVDGAAFTLLMGADKIREFRNQGIDIKPKARVVATAVVGSDPDLMLTGPIDASREALKRAGLTVDQIDRWEINEAFAVVPLAVMQDLGINPDLVNVWGGAIAHGHPIGATGAALAQKAIAQLEDEKLRYALVTLCIGMGQGIATIFERVEDIR